MALPPVGTQRVINDVVDIVLGTVGEAGVPYPTSFADAIATVPVDGLFIMRAGTVDNPTATDLRYVRTTTAPGYALTADQPVSKNTLASPIGASQIGVAGGYATVSDVVARGPVDVSIDYPAVMKIPVNEFYVSPPDLTNLPDRRAELIAMVNKAASNTRQAEQEVVLRGEGYVGFSGSIALPNRNVRIISDGDARFVPKANTNIPLFLHKPADPSTYYPLTTDTPYGSNKLPVGPTNIALFPINGYVHIRSQALLPCLDNPQNDKLGQVVKVIGKEGVGTLLLDQCLYYDFLVADTAEVAPVPNMLIGSRFENIKMGVMGIPNFSARLLDVSWMAGARLVDIHYENGRALADGDIGENAARTIIGGTNIVDLYADGFEFVNGGYYGWSPGVGCSNWYIKNGRGVRLRHVLSTMYSGSGAGYGEPVNITMENVEGHFCDYAAFDSHATGFGLHLKNVRSIGGQLDAGIQLRSRAATVEDSRTERSFLDGIGIEFGAVDAQIIRHVSRSNRRTGISSNAARTLIEHAIIENNGGTTGNAGIVISDGQILGGRIKGNIGPAINVSSAVAVNRLFVNGTEIERSTSQTRAIVLRSGVDPNSVTTANLKLKGTTAAGAFPGIIEQAGLSATSPRINDTGTVWSTEAAPSAPRYGKVALVAGAATVLTAAIRNYLGAASLPPYRSRVLITRSSLGATEERFWVSAISDGTSFTIRSSDVASTSEVDWQIL